MDWTLAAGLTVIGLAYGATIAMIGKSKRIIERIRDEKLSNAREIRKGLGL